MCDHFCGWITNTVTISLHISDNHYWGCFNNTATIRHHINANNLWVWSHNTTTIMQNISDNHYWGWWTNTVTIMDHIKFTLYFWDYQDLCSWTWGVSSLWCVTVLQICCDIKYTYIIVRVIHCIRSTQWTFFEKCSKKTRNREVAQNRVLYLINKLNNNKNYKCIFKYIFCACQPAGQISS